MSKVILDPLDLLDLKEKLECMYRRILNVIYKLALQGLVFLANRERMVVMEMLVLLGLLGDLEKEDCQECLEFLGLKDIEAFLVLMGQRVTLDPLEKREKMDLQVPWEL